MVQSSRRTLLTGLWSELLWRALPLCAPSPEHPVWRRCSWTCAQCASAAFFVLLMKSWCGQCLPPLSGCQTMLYLGDLEGEAVTLIMLVLQDKVLTQPHLTGTCLWRWGWKVIAMVRFRHGHQLQPFQICVSCWKAAGQVFLFFFHITHNCYFLLKAEVPEMSSKGTYSSLGYEFLNSSI